MNTKDLPNWVVYYCYPVHWIEEARCHYEQLMSVHGVEIPNSSTWHPSNTFAAEDWFRKQYPCDLVFLGCERRPNDWYSSGGLSACAYYVRRVWAMRGIVAPEATPDPDDIMRAVRDFSKSHR